MDTKNWPIGWLSSEGKLYECEFMEHLTLAERIAIQCGASEEKHYDEWLLEHGCCHLTVTRYVEHAWAVIFPYNTEHLTPEQHNFLKPYIEENKDCLSYVCKTDVKYEFDDIFV